MKWLTYPVLLGASHSSERLRQVFRSLQRRLYVDQNSSLPPRAATKVTPSVSMNVSRHGLPGSSQIARTELTIWRNASTISSSATERDSGPYYDMLLSRMNTGGSQSVSRKTKCDRPGARRVRSVRWCGEKFGTSPSWAKVQRPYSTGWQLGTLLSRWVALRTCANTVLEETT